MTCGCKFAKIKRYTVCYKYYIYYTYIYIYIATVLSSSTVSSIYAITVTRLTPTITTTLIGSIKLLLLHNYYLIIIISPYSYDTNFTTRM